jgi:hypothetical protein
MTLSYQFSKFLKSKYAVHELGNKTLFITKFNISSYPAINSKIKNNMRHDYSFPLGSLSAGILAL